jgi:hypothetical protein
MTKSAEQQAIEHVRKGEPASYSKANIQQIRVNDFLDGYAAGKADAERWIPVTERLPELQDYYAIVIDTQYRRKRVAMFRVVDRLWVDCESRLVTHWMPLENPVIKVLKDKGSTGVFFSEVKPWH